MGCGASRPETEEGGNNGREGEIFKMITRGRSIHGSVVADSFTLDKQFLENPGERNRDGYETEETKKEENGGGSYAMDMPENSILLCPGSPSFRIYCAGDDVDDDDDDDGFLGPVCYLRRNKCQSNDNKKARIARIGKGFKNVRKLLTHPVASSDKPPARAGH
ncbi:PREDICTED: uncharacterized protein LOC104823989 [Tarenaya hassleriana]|uniref:uncharacterized protein LOC104823989 n=1 Tax=Tarenaya hassleriana TaxID=28532 RepID=UPI00053C5D4E|nr:PREDICTED: uncharacterized protein LOC104823989 [Tarenaya hassleriana]